MAMYVTTAGAQHQIDFSPTIYKLAMDANLTVPQYINREHADADPKIGTAYHQILASEGLVVGQDKDFGLRSVSMADVLDGKSGFSAATNNRDTGGPLGSSSRTLFPIAVISAIESAMAKDRTTDLAQWSRMVGARQSVAGENFEQPVINYAGANGPENTRAQRIAQLAEAPSMLKITTSDRFRKIPTWSIGMEISDQALRATTLDLVALTMQRYFEIEYDAHVYEYLSNIFAGDLDGNTGAVSSVASSSLDAASTGGVLTHKAWVKFLARNRKFRTIDYAICTIGTYLKIESRTGRPGTNNYDPTLARIDPQAVAQNVTFGSDVKFFIVDDLADGGPIAEDTVWALDSRYAITEVTNAAAAYTASENFALRRSSAFRVDWGSMAYRTFGNSDLRAFDVLTISA
jgi:hypothetical protein